jgi:hypothetical protein
LRSLKQLVLIFAIIQAFPVFANAELKSDHLTWQLDLKSRIEWWIIRRDVWGNSYYFGWHADHQIETFRPQAHLMFQPEIIAKYQKFYLRVSTSISSSTSLKQKLMGYPDEPAFVSNAGAGKWYGAGAEIGYGGIGSGYFGIRYRRIEIINWPNDSLFSHTVIDPVIGMRIHSTKFFNHENIVTDLNMFIGLSLLANIFDREQSVQHTAIAGIGLDMGWRPKGGLLDFTLGYSIELFSKYIGKSFPSSRFWQDMTSFTQGASLTVSWAH